MYCIYRRQYWAGMKQWTENAMHVSGEFLHPSSINILTFPTEAEAQFIINSLEKDPMIQYEVRLCKY